MSLFSDSPRGQTMWEVRVRGPFLSQIQAVQV